MNINPSLSYPTEWDTVQLKRLFNVETGATPKSSTKKYWGGDIAWVTPTDVSGDGSKPIETTGRTLTKEGYANCSATLVSGGSIVFTKRAPIGKVAILGIDACCNQGCLLLEPIKEVDTRFYLHVLRIQEVYLNGLGSGSTFMELGTDDLENLVVPLPKYKHQKRISDRLESLNEEIDRLIAAKESLLETLDQRRRAVITHAVTRGLDSDAPTRDSKHKWAGDIPKHWKTMHLKRAVKSFDYGTSARSKSEGSVAVLGMGDIGEGEIHFDDLSYLDEFEIDLLLKPGDLLFNRTNSLERIGKVALFRGYEKGEVSFASYLVRLRCKDWIDPEYLNHFLNSPGVLAWARGNAIPAIGQANLSPRRYGYLPIIVPPLGEQRLIVDHIEDVTGRLDQVREGTKETIRLLKQRRTALITAAITGQLEVEVPA